MYSARVNISSTGGISDARQYGEPRRSLSWLVRCFELPSQRAGYTGPNDVPRMPEAASCSPRAISPQLRGSTPFEYKANAPPACILMSGVLTGDDNRQEE
jgi:hypothetical protein